jgi:puromycin-sensitive aminopeptidase
MDAVIVNSVGVFCTLERAQEIEDYFTASPIPKSAMRVTQVVESIRINGNMLSRVRESQLTQPAFWSA